MNDGIIFRILYIAIIIVNGYILLFTDSLEQPNSIAPEVFSISLVLLVISIFARRRARHNQ